MDNNNTTVTAYGDSYCFVFITNNSVHYSLYVVH